MVISLEKLNLQLQNLINNREQAKIAVHQHDGAIALLQEQIQNLAKAQQDSEKLQDLPAKKPGRKKKK